ncbi:MULTISPECIES: hypothetical protein [Halorussus]|uniref:hypothetical protein n=1 Tax=Halorussus TaxID=1070314 RepID=UPI000E214823|nr:MULTISPECIES: hypothetical protein [Halorussus]NHN59952.1 hypothetical protein [Halorussus sp. JP-T4]
MNDTLEFAALLLFAAAPLAAVLTGYAVFRAHRRAGGARPVRRGVGVAVGLLVAAPAAFLLVGRLLVGGGLAGGPLAGGPAAGLVALGPLALLGVGVYLLAGGRRPALSERARKKR